jgi:bifunctional non-homologous end joining protein LigD
MPKAAIKIGKRVVAVSNLDKVLYPGGRFTKADVLDYYARVGPFLLTHFENRPVTLVRYPDGVFGESFFEKNAPGFTPDWVATFPVPRSEGGVINYILINDLPTLLWAANLAALELHPFLHRAPRIDRPTHMVFDLDPGEGATILNCAEVAFLLRELLAKFHLKCLPKVSGSKGIQIYVPLNTPTSYDGTAAFAQSLARLLSREHPKLIVSDMAKALRAGKVFIDWSQNNEKKTTVGVYSLRAKRERPFVSMPVSWQELGKALRASDAEKLFFEPKPALARLKKLGDLFAPVIKLKQRLPEQFAVERASTRRPKALAPYAAKRNFACTNEPPAVLSRSAQGSRRRFVVQKHAAQQLHYDLRLEMHDVLKSWAVPKGIPLKQGERRSAFATEDHPLEYLDFEGTIPEGEYGGGTVMVWDIGTYDRVEGNYYKGELVLFLAGRKLKGEWTLKRVQGNDDANGKAVWLLTRTGADVPRIPTRQGNLSALSGRTIEQIASQRSAVWKSNRPTVVAAVPKPVKKRNAVRPVKTPAPQFVPPMRATLVEKLPEGPEWIYEIKWDGYRALASKHGEKVRLFSLKNRDLAAAFPAIVEAVGTVNAHTVLMDGEIVAVNAKGQPSFQALQNRASLGRGWHLVYYAFDLLSLEGEDLRRSTLEHRREKLRRILAGSAVRYSTELPGSPRAVARTVKRAGLEGIVAKRKDSVYAAGTRSPAWQKVKLDQSQEFVIGGYNPEGGSFSSLLLGYYEGNNLIFAGKVRQGFNPSLRALLLKHLARLRVKRCPFVNLPSSKRGHFGEGVTAEDMPKLHWVRPELVANVAFTEWTNYGLLRHATFLGLREDKEPREVIREVPAASNGKVRSD